MALTISSGATPLRMQSSTTALIWICAWVVGIVAVHWREELNTHHVLTFLHKALASTLLFLIVLRVAWRLTHPAPDLPDTMSR
ncbi:hypothetical protein ACK1U3_21320 [Pseudomonas promysalinigenes]|uniref:hypothetical protein n=1 Tax=Pseudomonas promysalinigenes TaxID=485898 RepID=UPI00391737A6